MLHLPPLLCQAEPLMKKSEVGEVPTPKTRYIGWSWEEAAGRV